MLNASIVSSIVIAKSPNKWPMPRHLAQVIGAGMGSRLAKTWREQAVPGKPLVHQLGHAQAADQNGTGAGRRGL